MVTPELELELELELVEKQERQKKGVEKRLMSLQEMGIKIRQTRDPEKEHLEKENVGQDSVRTQ